MEEEKNQILLSIFFLRSSFSHTSSSDCFNWCQFLSISFPSFKIQLAENLACKPNKSWNWGSLFLVAFQSVRYDWCVVCFLYFHVLGTWRPFWMSWRKFNNFLMFDCRSLSSSLIIPANLPSILIWMICGPFLGGESMLSVISSYQLMTGTKA